MIVDDQNINMLKNEIERKKLNYQQHKKIKIISYTINFKYISNKFQLTSYTHNFFNTTYSSARH